MDGAQWQAIGICYDRVHVEAGGTVIVDYYGLGNEYLIDFVADNNLWPQAETGYFTSTQVSFLEESFDEEEVEEIWDDYRAVIDANFDELELELAKFSADGLNSISLQLIYPGVLNPERYFPSLTPPFDHQSASDWSGEETLDRLERLLALCNEYGLYVDLQLRFNIPGADVSDGHGYAIPWPYNVRSVDPAMYTQDSADLIETVLDGIDPDLHSTIMSWMVAWEPPFFPLHGSHDALLSEMDWHFFEDKYVRSPRSGRVNYQEEYEDVYFAHIDRMWRDWLTEQYGSVALAESEFGESANFDYPLAGDPDTDASLGSITNSTPRIQAYRRFVNDYLARTYLRALNDMRTVDDDRLYTTKIEVGSAHGWWWVYPYDGRALLNSLDFLGQEGYVGTRTLERYDQNGNLAPVDLAGESVWIDPTQNSTSNRYRQSRDALGAAFTMVNRYLTRSGAVPLVYEEVGYILGFPNEGSSYVGTHGEERRRQFYEMYFWAFDKSDSDGGFFWNHYGGPESYYSPTHPDYSPHLDWGLMEWDETDATPFVPDARINGRDAYDEVDAEAENAASRSGRHTRTETVWVDPASMNNYQQLLLDATSEIYTHMQNDEFYVEVRGVGDDADSHSNDPEDFIVVGIADGEDADSGQVGPLKYFNSLFDHLEILGADSQWHEATDGRAIPISSSGPVQGRLALANNGDGVWNYQNVILVSKSVASNGTRTDEEYAYFQDSVDPLEDYDFSNVTLATGISEPTQLEVNLRITDAVYSIIEDYEFGERRIFWVDPREHFLADDMDRRPSQDLGANWTVNGDDDHFVIEDDMLYYGRNGSNTTIDNWEAQVAETVESESPVVQPNTVVEFDVEWSQAEEGEFPNNTCPGPHLEGWSPSGWVATEPDTSDFWVSLASDNAELVMLLAAHLDESSDTSKSDVLVNGTPSTFISQASGSAGAFAYRTDTHVSLTYESDLLTVAVTPDGGSTTQQTYSLSGSPIGDLRLEFGMYSDVARPGCDRGALWEADYAGFKIDNVSVRPTSDYQAPGVNNDCGDAVVVDSSSALTGNLTGGATASGGSLFIGGDIWYQLDIPFDNTIVTIEWDADSTEDAFLGVYSSCSDDIDEPLYDQSGTDELCFQFTTGQDVWVRVGGDHAYSGTSQSFTVTFGQALATQYDLRSGGADLMIHGGDSLDHIGAGWDALGWGDIDGDSVEDWVIGVGPADAKSDSKVDAGEIVILYGAGNVNFASLSDFNLDQLLANTSLWPDKETFVFGADGEDQPSVPSGDFAGITVEVGDVNGDSYDDVVIGAFAAHDGKGEVYIIFGSSGISNRAEIDLANPTAGSPSVTITTLQGVDEDESMGYNLALGDFNNDGKEDVIIGALFASPSTGTRAGRAYVVKGYSPGSSQTVSLNGATGFSITEVIGESADDWLGAGVAAGDFNGDGFDDLVLGAPGPINEWFEDISPTNSPFNIDVDDDRPGRLYIIEGFTTLFNTSEINLSTTGLDHIVITGDYDRGQFGRTVAIGNVDNDSGGRADILVGARDHGIAYSGNPFNVGSHVPGDGKAYVIHGSASITSDFTISSPPSGARVTEILAANPEDSLGESAGLADVNGDGFEDILLGAPFAERAAGTGDLSTLRVGEAYIIYGGPCLPDEIDFSAGEQGTLILGMHPGEWTGTSVESLGDLNNDGFVDLTVGAGFGNALSASGPFDVDSEEISDGDKTGFMATILGAGEANGSALTTLATAAGNAPPTEFGPVVRATLDYTGGSNTSGTTATLTRTKSGVTGITLADVADVRWKIETNRTGWSTATLTLEYLDSEVSGLVENDLYIYRAANLSGPWSQLTSGRTVQPSINRISSTIASSQLDGHFILVEVAPDPKQ